MRAFVLFVVVMAFAAPDRPAPPVPKLVLPDDLARMDGTWAVESYHFDGGMLTPDQIAVYPKLIMKKGTYRWTSLQTGGLMTIDATKSPKTVDYREGGPNGPLHLGIYELSGDTFKDCIARPGSPRPTDFTVPPGSGRTLFVYRRVKD